MLKDITLGQYFPGKSPVHLLDPRCKLIMLVVYIVALFTASGWLSYGLLFGFLVMVVKISTIPPKSILKGMKPLVMILVFTGVLNLFFTTGEGKPVVDFWIFTIYREGIVRAIFMVTRILMLISCTFLLTYTDKIMNAQKARGADFESGSIMDRAKALIPILVPLFISAFRRADELATAMECRCYQGGEGRTKMKLLRYTLWDFRAFGIGALLLAAVFALASFGL